MQKEVHRYLKSPEESDAENFKNSYVGKMIDNLNAYADERKNAVERGAETAGLAALFIRIFGTGMMHAADVMFLFNRDKLQDEIDRLVVEINPNFYKDEQAIKTAQSVGVKIVDRHPVINSYII